MTVLFNWYPFFSVESLFNDPNTEFKLLKAAFVKTHNLPRCPPGASWRTFNLWTLHVSTPGKFLAACLTKSSSFSWTRRGPFLMTYLECLYLPAPAFIFFDLLTFARSSPRPKSCNFYNIDFVVLREFKSSRTNGNSGTLSTLWPLAITSGTQAEAARAEATACLLWVVLHF